MAAGRRRWPGPATPAAGPRPVFIAGAPRSGTTLVEQILSSHPAIAAGDE
ncbi:sulfotransferase, partial [Azospirillum formosense]